jgi:hypothetical protein
MNKQELTDVGTRYQHLVELRDLWEAGLSILNRYNFSTDKERKVELQQAIKLLNKNLDNLAAYDFKGYNLRASIEDISRDPSKITGGRGTPLQQTTLEE